MSDKRKRFGKYGEDQAARFLKRSGYEIIERNFQNKLGEIDIIARDGDVLSFVEVKSRRDGHFGSALEAVDGNKMRRMTKAALSFIKMRGLSEVKCRFDVLAFSAGSEARQKNIELIKDAFPLEGRYLY